MNPDTGIPEIHTEAALRAVDVVLCKSRLCVELMAAFRKDKSMRFGIMYTNHTTPDPLRLGAPPPRLLPAQQPSSISVASFPRAVWICHGDA